MKIYRGMESLPDIGATTITVGSFDGVHSGHSSLLRELIDRARSKGLKSVVVSFSPHPRVTLGRSEGLCLLSSDSEKATLLAQQGVDALLLLTFDDNFSRLSYEEFITQYLVGHAQMAEMIVGFNHHIGHNAGSYQQIVECGKRLGFEVTLAPQLKAGEQQISSTTIRRAIEQGEITKASELLNHPYLMEGQSDEQGRVTFDEPLKLIPPMGNYSVKINDQDEVIEIDQRGAVWSNIKGTKLEIKVLNKI